MVKNILTERNRLNNYLLNKEGNTFLAKVLENLWVVDWRQTKDSYVFNFYVLEIDSIPNENDYGLKIIADRSAVGVDNKMSAREINQLDFKSMELTRLDLNNIDPHPHTTIYATWSAVVAGTWGDEENTNETKRMLVEIELQLQSMWNHCKQLKPSLNSLLDYKEKDLDQDGLLIAITRFLKLCKQWTLPSSTSSTRKGKDLDQDGLLITTTRFLKLYKQWTLPSSTSSTRKVDVLNKLVTTSRLDKEVGDLESSLHKVEQKLEEHRQQEHNYRRELGQDGITILLVLLAAIGVPQVIINLISEGWAQRWWVLAILVVLLVAGGGISYCLTVKRTKQRHRK